MPDTAFVSANGTRLACRVWAGEAGPVICLPGLYGHKGTFDSLAAQLTPEFHLIALDLRGRGESDKPADGYGFAYHARDVLGFADALGFDSFAVMGHSFGATVGVYLASIRPARVRALVMLDGGADPSDTVFEAMRPAVRRLASVYDTQADYLAAMRSLPFYRPWNDALERYLLEDLQALPDGRVQSRSSVAALERDLDVHAYYSMCLHFPALRCPVLFVRPEQGLQGEHDHVFDARAAAAFAASIPHCKRVDVAGGNHFTMVLHDDPPATAPVREFLRGVYGSGD